MEYVPVVTVSMDRNGVNTKFNYNLKPGCLYLSRNPATIRCVVGTSVSVCLWDKQQRFGGMNHFIHPVIRDADKATTRYGNVATAALVDMMLEQGSAYGHMVAQVTGGAVPETNRSNDLGARNVEAAREVLVRKGIAITSEDVGGTLGRKILFHTDTGQLLTMKVHQLRDEDWISDECDAKALPDTDGTTPRRARDNR